MSRIARSPRSYLLRVGIGLAVLGILALTAMRASAATPGDLTAQARTATQLFTSWGLVGFIALVFATPLVVCGVVAAERSRGALELLFTTHLSDAELLAGKLGAALVLLVANYVATVPVVLFLALFGGVDPNRLLLIVSYTLSATVLAASLGLYFSVVCRDTPAAMLRTWMSMVFVWIGIPVLAQILVIVYRYTAHAGPSRVNIRLAFDLFTVANPPACLVFSIGAWPIGWVPSAFDTWPFTLIASIALFALGVRRLRRVALPAATPRRQSVSTRIALRAIGDRLLDFNPMFWRSLVLRTSSGNVGLIAFGWASMATLGVFFSIQPNYKVTWPWCVAIASTSLVLVQIAAGSSAEATICSLRERGLLPLIGLTGILPIQFVVACFFDVLRSLWGLLALLFAAMAAATLGLPGNTFNAWKIEAIVRFLAPLLCTSVVTSAGGLLVASTVARRGQFFAAWALPCLGCAATLLYCTTTNLVNHEPSTFEQLMDSPLSLAVSVLLIALLLKSPRGFRPLIGAALVALLPWACVQLLIELPRVATHSPYRLGWICSGSWWSEHVVRLQFGPQAISGIPQFVLGNMLAAVVFLLLASWLLSTSSPDDGQR